MNINLEEEEHEESIQKDEVDVLLDEADEFQNNNTIDEGLTKAISGIFATFYEIEK